jgi:hypothetical protein
MQESLIKLKGNKLSLNRLACNHLYFKAKYQKLKKIALPMQMNVDKLKGTWFIH